MKFLSKLFGKSNEEKHKEVSDLAQKGDLFFQKEEYDKALKYYIEATRLSPNIAALHFNVGLVHERKGNCEKAISGFKQSLKLGSDNDNIYQLLGNCYMILGNHLMAINNYKEHIRLKPDDALILSHLGICYHNIKNYKQSDKYHLEAISKSPDKSYFYRVFGEILNRRPELDRAFEMFKKAFELVPEDYYSLEQIADYHAIAEDDYEKAQFYYEKIPRLERTPNVHKNLSAIYFKSKDKERFMNEVEYSIKHYPNNVELFYRYFSAKHNAKQTANLVEEIQVFLQRNPDASKIVRALGISYLEIDNIEKALECAEKLMVSEPEDGHTFILLAACFLRRNETGKAAIEFVKSRDFFREGNDINCEAYAIKGLGCCRLVKGNKKEAFSLFQDGLTKVEDKDKYLEDLKDGIQKLSFEGKKEALLMIEQLEK